MSNFGEKFASRFNSFVLKGDTVYDAIEKIKTIPGVTHLEFNYPEHFKDTEVSQIKEIMGDLQVNGVATRFKPPLYLNGEFSHYDEEIRRESIELAKGAVDKCHELGGKIVTVWLAYDGYDYPFQMDYGEAWNKMIEAFREVCDYAAKYDIKISIEYKPFEERNHAMLDSVGMTLYAIELIDRPNLGCTLDFCHMLMKFDSPAYGLAVAALKDRIYGLHMNDGYGQMDGGLIFGSINLIQCVEFVYYLKKTGYDGVVFFDTFPIRENPEREIKANIDTYKKICKKIDEYGMDRIADVIASHDGVRVQEMIQEMFL